MLGLGVMLHALYGDDGTNSVIQSSLGKIINKVWISEKVLCFLFEDGKCLNIRDDGQSCCEYRYMDTDDNLSEYSGAKLLSVEISGHTVNKEDKWGDVQEIQFLDVHTDKGMFQIKNYNNHNGYYGGFWLAADDGTGSEDEYEY